MMNELRTRLEAAAGDPTHPLDIERVDDRARQLGSRRRVRRIATGVMLCGAAAVATVIATHGSAPTTTHIATPTTIRPAAEAFDSHGDQVRLPPGWVRATSPLVPYMSWPREILSAATFPLSPDDRGPGCDAQLPKGALDAMQPTDAFVWLVEDTIPTNSQIPFDKFGVQADPSTFPPRPTHFTAYQFSSLECSGPTWSYPHLTFHQLDFTDNNRVFSAYVVIGDRTTPTRKAGLWSLLDSLDLTSSR
jgi:hypothetical protein